MSAVRRPEPVFKRDISLDEIQTVSHFRRALRYLYDHGIQRGDLTGWPCLDELYSVRAREWTLVTGVPSHGKSSWLDNLMVNLSLNRVFTWAIFSAENLPLERHAASLASIYTGKPFNPGPRQRMSEREFEQAEYWLDLNFKFICPPEEDCTLERILHIAKMIHDHWGLNGMVIDPWNELDHSRPVNQSETEYISASLTKVRRFAREHETHVFLVAHPTKLQAIDRKNGVTQYPVPTPYDVSGSAHWRNKADNCITVWRNVEEPQTPTQIHVQKVRFREIGRVGMCELGYDLPTGQYIDPRYGPRPVPARILPDNPQDFVKQFRGIARAGEREPGCDDE